jgi:hypothetical protein
MFVCVCACVCTYSILHHTGCMYVCVRMCMYALSSSADASHKLHMHKYAPICIRTRLHTVLLHSASASASQKCTHSHAHMQTHTYACTCICSNIRPKLMHLKNVQTQNAHTPLHTYIHIHTHTYIHIHTCMQCSNTPPQPMRLKNLLRGSGGISRTQSTSISMLQRDRESPAKTINSVSICLVCCVCILLINRYGR